MAAINYEKDTCWYDNTHDMLGEEWLYNAIVSRKGLPRKFAFLSPSANRGMYEKYAYDELVKKGYCPIFYVGDINSGKLKNKVKEDGDFFWISGEGTNAADIGISKEGEGTVPITFDIILDCKGATWHSLNRFEDLIRLFEKYCGLLKNDDSVLIIDYAIPSKIRRVSNVWILFWYKLKGIRTKRVKMHYFSEYTTGFYLSKYIGKKFKEHFTPMRVVINSPKLRDDFDLVICTKSQLTNFIKELNEMGKWKYFFRRGIRSFGISLFDASTVILVGFFILILLVCVIV